MLRFGKKILNEYGYRTIRSVSFLITPNKRIEIAFNTYTKHKKLWHIIWESERGGLWFIDGRWPQIDFAKSYPWTFILRFHVVGFGVRCVDKRTYSNELGRYETVQETNARLQAGWDRATPLNEEAFKEFSKEMGA